MRRIVLFLFLVGLVVSLQTELKLPVKSDTKEKVSLALGKLVDQLQYFKTPYQNKVNLYKKVAILEQYLEEVTKQVSPYSNVVSGKSNNVVGQGNVIVGSYNTLKGMNNFVFIEKYTGQANGDLLIGKWRIQIEKKQLILIAASLAISQINQEENRKYLKYLIPNKSNEYFGQSVSNSYTLLKYVDDNPFSIALPNTVTRTGIGAGRFSRYGLQQTQPVQKALHFSNDLSSSPALPFNSISSTLDYQPLFDQYKNDKLLNNKQIPKHLPTISQIAKEQLYPLSQNIQRNRDSQASFYSLSQEDLSFKSIFPQSPSGPQQQSVQQNTAFNNIFPLRLQNPSIQNEIPISKIIRTSSNNLQSQPIQQQKVSYKDITSGNSLTSKQPPAQQNIVFKGTIPKSLSNVHSQTLLRNQSRQPNLSPIMLTANSSPVMATTTTQYFKHKSQSGNSKAESQIGFFTKSSPITSKNIRYQSNSISTTQDIYKKSAGNFIKSLVIPNNKKD